MKTLFTIKYTGKTLLIMCAVMALGKIAKVDMLFYEAVGLGSFMYCTGSISYQTKLRERKQLKQK